MDANKSATRRNLEQRLKKSRFFNINGSEPRSLTAIHYGIQKGEPLSLGVTIASNRDLIVIPWKSMGSASLAVLPISQKGRVSELTHLLRAHGQSMSCLALNLADSTALATGCVDAHVSH